MSLQRYKYFIFHSELLNNLNPINNIYKIMSSKITEISVLLLLLIAQAGFTNQQQPIGSVNIHLVDLVLVQVVLIDRLKTEQVIMIQLILMLKAKKILFLFIMMIIMIKRILMMIKTVIRMKIIEKKWLLHHLRSSILRRKLR